MILKVKGTTGNWWYYGELERVNVIDCKVLTCSSQPDAPVAVRLPGSDGHVPYTNFDARLLVLDLKDGVPEKGDDCEGGDLIAHRAKLIIASHNGDKFSVLTDSLAYLLNEQGQTIDRFV